MDLFKETRLQKIMDILRERGALTTADLRQILGVSSMTVHRDLDELAKAGLVERVHGGVLLAGEKRSNGVCAYCGKEVNPRTAFVLHLKDGQIIQACCPHCGLRLIDLHPDAVSGMAADFLHGTTSNLKTAAFLLQADLVVCCAPSVFVFASREEAERMQTGFGGKVLDLPQALADLREEMHLERHPARQN